MKEKFEARASSEGRERGRESLRFYVAEHGLETQVDEVLGAEEYKERDPEEFAPNRKWSSVEVANKADQNRWVELQNEKLRCLWTPNQDREERLKNADRVREIEQEQRELEGKARREQ